MKTKILICLVVCSALYSCGSPEKVPYMVEAERLQLYELEQNAKIYEAKIMAKDVLTISVNTTVPEAAAPFNLGSNAGSGVGIQNGSAMSIQGASLQTYIVDKEGYIEYPIVGKLKLMGLTRTEAQDFIISKIHPAYITERPIVNVRFKNYKVSVLGEVNRPGQFVVESEQCTIFDALSMAGDMTIYGKRENVMLIREDNNGKKSITRINLQNPRLILDPQIYYLQQNDVLYIEPNRTKAKASSIGTGETYAISILTTLVSITTLLITILR